MVLVWYPKCSTCQRAKAWLDEHGVTYTLRDIKEENPNAEELRAWHEKSGLPLRRFFNTSGLLYKGQYILGGEYGMLVKRPLIVADDFVLVGFREAEWSAALG